MYKPPIAVWTVLTAIVRATIILQILHNGSKEFCMYQDIHVFLKLFIWCLSVGGSFLEKLCNFIG